MPVISAIQEVEIGRIMVQSQPRQKVSKTPVGMVVHFHNPSYMEGKGKMAAVQE
jgi:hypothetical protein